MPGYVKLFSKILDSTIWVEDSDTRIIWVTMLAMADRDGIVECTVPGLAGRAKVSLEKTEFALKKFQQPDKYSWSQVQEGRRIQPTDRGWLLINYEAYREMLGADDVREKNRLRQERFRERRRNVMSRSVTTVSRKVTPVTQSNDNTDTPSDTDTDTETKTIKSKAGLRPFVPPSLEEVASYCKERHNEVDASKFHDYYTSQGWYVGTHRMKDWKAAVRNWERRNYGGEFRDGYQKTGRAQREQLGTQKRRQLDNAEAIIRATMGRDSSLDSSGQEARPDRGGNALLEGEVKRLP